MFEKEIQTAKHRLSSQLLTDKTYVYLQDVLIHPDVHDFYKQFFRGEVEWWIYEQQMLREANPRFHYADEAFAAVLATYDEQCKRTARFDHGELVSLIDLAVKTRVNYLLRPRTTLKWFVYRGEPTKSLREVLLRCAYFSCYNYLIDEFDKWAENKGVENAQQDILSVIEFERLIEHIDNEIILEHTTSEFTELLAPLYDFFDELQPEEGHSAIPTPALIIFLDDKGILRISQELERLMKEDELHSITRSEFLNVIDSVISQVEEETGVQGYVQDSTIPLDFDHTVLQRQEQEEVDREQKGSDGTTEGAEQMPDAPSEVKDAERATLDSDTHEHIEANAAAAETDDETSSDASAERSTQEEPTGEAEVANAAIAEAEALEEVEEVEYTTIVEEEPLEIYGADGCESDVVLEGIEGIAEEATYAEVSEIAVIQEADAVAVVNSEEYSGMAVVEPAGADIAVGSMEEIEETETVAIEHRDEEFVVVDDVESEEDIEPVFEDVSIVDETDVVEVQQADYSTVAEEAGEELVDSDDSEEMEGVLVVEDEHIVVDVPLHEHADTLDDEDTVVPPVSAMNEVSSDNAEEELMEAENAELHSSFSEEIESAAIDEITEEGDNEPLLALEVEDVLLDVGAEAYTEVEENAEALAPLADDESSVIASDRMEEEDSEPLLALEIEDVLLDIGAEAYTEAEENAEALAPLADDESSVIASDRIEEEDSGQLLALEIEDALLDTESDVLAVPEDESEEIDSVALGENSTTANDISDGGVDVHDDEATFFTDDDTYEHEKEEEHVGEGQSAVTEKESGSEQTGIPALYPPVQALIDDNLRQRVLKHVFHHKEEQLLAVLDQVNTTQSWREASVLIDRVFMENEVDPYSSIAKKFSDVVYERFL